MNISFKNLFFALAFVFTVFTVMILADSILIPISMGLLLSLVLYPLTKKYESFGLNKIISAFFSILSLLLVVGGGMYFFISQLINLPQELSDFEGKLTSLLKDIILIINNYLNPNQDLKSEDITNQIKIWSKKSALPFVQNTFFNTASFIIGMITTLTYIFLFLIYRTGLTKALVRFADKHNQNRVLNMLKNIQKVGQQYLSGMIILIIVLGFMNSLGLWFIGIDSPFLFGYMAAVMSLIPYIGTLLGAIIPILYAFMTNDSILVPFYVACWFYFVELIESNILGPKIVGSNLNVNAFASILSLIIGGYVWGVAGMILFLPLTSMLKVFCEEFESLKPIGLMLDSSLYNGYKDDNENKNLWLKKLKIKIFNILNKI